MRLEWDFSGENVFIVLVNNVKFVTNSCFMKQLFERNNFTRTMQVRIDKSCGTYTF